MGKIISYCIKLENRENIKNDIKDVNSIPLSNT